MSGAHTLWTAPDTKGTPVPAFVATLSVTASWGELSVAPIAPSLIPPHFRQHHLSAFQWLHLRQRQHKWRPDAVFLVSPVKDVARFRSPTPNGTTAVTLAGTPQLLLVEKGPSLSCHITRGKWCTVYLVDVDPRQPRNFLASIRRTYGDYGT